MNNKKTLWITLSLVNLCIVALLGLSLRSKYLFPISFINYRYFISAHSHFAFGGWVTLALMILYIYYLLPENFQQKKIYQVVLWCIEINALGMAISFPFKGYAFFSIVFSTLFIFSTYAFSIVFIKDLFRAKLSRSVTVLSCTAIFSLVISSIGPFTLAYILATHSGGSNLYRDAVYTYLHFQYNGFFTLSIFAVLFANAFKEVSALQKKIMAFSVWLAASVVPTLFLSLLWHPHQPWIQVLGVIGCILIACVLVRFFSFWKSLRRNNFFSQPFARMLWLFSMISFSIKMLLQMGIIIPEMSNAVYGYRPIIIGFLHLVFLGLVSFFILAVYLETANFHLQNRFTRSAFVVFTTGVFLNEIILMIQGIGLMLRYNNEVYPWLLWIAAIVLFSGAVLILSARLKTLAPSSKKNHGLLHDL